MLVEDQRYGLYSTESPLLQHAILALDRWITTGSRPQEGCMTRDANPTFIAERQTRDPRTRCEQLYPSASFPREVAGEDVAADIVKCRPEADRPRGLPRPPQRDAARPAAGDLPDRRVRLDAARASASSRRAGTWLSFGPP